MCRTIVIVLSAVCLSLALTGVLAGRATAGFEAGVSFSDDGIRSFHLAVGDYYRMPESSVVVVARRGIPDDELPVVFFLSARIGVAPDVIVSLRLGGMSWMDICIRHGLRADVFYVPVKMGPPYGKAYGHYKTPRNKWNTLRLGDGDIVNMVNLRFMTEHYGYPAAEVMKMRDRGTSFVVINGNAKKSKGGGAQGNSGKNKNGGGGKGNSEKGKGKR